MKLNINDFLQEQGITKTRLAEQIGWTANSLSQALRIEGESAKFMLLFAQSNAFPDWTIGYDLKEGEYYFTDEKQKFEGVPGGYNFFTWPKSFLLKENTFFNHAPHIFSFIAALPCDEVDVYHDGKMFWVLAKSTDQVYGAFPVEDCKDIVDFMNRISE